ncbi:polysaccharide biosynthesis tyrosine autokinase [Novipirellula sp. SH528]|uniref:polysaccharide biosynthesis tyrosine autokinase n=1 Tax=Novipirellula sp. SH528 TaxID=3454466 RepID=UPI003F9EEEEC
MKLASDRGLSYSKAPPITGSDRGMGAPQTHGGDSQDLVAALWRYRWAVLLPAIAGAVCGFLVYQKTPETFKSATRLMVESDRPAILDSMTGDVIGGVPSIEILESQLFSDRVVKMAFDDEQLAPFRDRFEDDSRVFLGIAYESLAIKSDFTDLRTAQSLVADLSFEHTDPELCQASVKAFSGALQSFFNEKHKSSRGELLRLISVAIDQLYPKMTELETQYRNFRRDAPLAWNSEGEAINPHRERQLFLVGQRSELVEKMRQKATELSAVKAIANQSKDPLIALNVISQLLNVKFVLPASDAALSQNMKEGDVQLAQLELDQQLIPLMIERNKMASEFGVSHPTVKQLDTELDMMKGELRRIVLEQTQRILQLRKENEVESINPAEQAKEALSTVVVAGEAELQLLKDQISEVEQQIADEKAASITIAKFEQDNAGMLRELDRNRELMNQLEEQMARVSLTEEEGGTQVLELTAPSRAARVGPSIVKTLGIGTFLGIALGAGLALLLEKNANTFRDPDEISGLLGVPVLTHIPFFKGRVRRPGKGEINPFKDLDPGMVVLHQPASIAAEAVRSFRTAVFFESAGTEGGKVIQVTSPLPGDGKTTVAENLACSIAQSGKRVLVIDCDLRRPQITDNFVMQDKLGLTNILNGDCDPSEACHQTPLSTLHMMPSGPIPANPAEALTLPDMGELIDLLRETYDYVILDTPPLLVVTDPSITAGLADGVVLALRVRRKSKPNAKESVNILRSVGANVFGVVINNSDESSASDGYRGYSYYRYGRFTNRYYQRNDKEAKSKDQNSPVTVEGRGLAGMPKAKKAEVVSVGEVVSEE